MAYESSYHIEKGAFFYSIFSRVILALIFSFSFFREIFCVVKNIFLGGEKFNSPQFVLKFPPLFHGVVRITPPRSLLIVASRESQIP